MKSSGNDYEEWSHFVGAGENYNFEQVITIQDLFPELSEAYGRVQYFLDQGIKLVSKQNNLNFQNISNDKVNFPEIEENEDLENIQDKLVSYIKTAVSSAESEARIAVKACEQVWKKDVLDQATILQQELKLDKHLKRAIEKTQTKIDALEEACKVNIKMKSALKKQYDILEELQSMRAEIQLDKASAEFYEQARRVKDDFKMRVQYSVTKVLSEQSKIREERLDKRQLNPFVFALGSISGLATIASFFPPATLIANPIAYGTGVAYSAASAQALVGSDKELAKNAHELEPLLKSQESSYDKVRDSSTKKYDAPLLEKIYFGFTPVSSTLNFIRGVISSRTINSQNSSKVSPQSSANVNSEKSHKHDDTRISKKQNFADRVLNRDIDKFNRSRE